MPWKECSVVDERLRFVARLLEGDSMSGMCREFGVSRKTGYKIFDRYKDHGLEALVREIMRADPFDGAIYVFRAKRADRLKLLFRGGTGVCCWETGPRLRTA